MLDKLKIGVDIDGVLSDSNKVFISHINNKYGLSWSTDDVRDYWFTDLSNIIGGREQIIEEWMFLHKNNLLLNCPTTSKAILFNMLPGEVNLVTHRDPITIECTQKWLKKNNLSRHKEVFFVNGPKSKTGKWDYFIEDCPENIEDLIPVVSEKIILFDHPYNREFNHSEKVIRVKCWEEITDFFKKEITKKFS